MKKANIEFVKFDSADVIATSGAPAPVPAPVCNEDHFEPKSWNYQIGFQRYTGYYLDLDDSNDFNWEKDHWFGNDNPGAGKYHRDGSYCDILN